jgi:parallel beta-helix repeat protein
MRRVARSVALVMATGALLLLPLPAAHASPGTWYVDNGNPNCSDSGPGTSSQPFCTIGAAALKVTAGQTVQVSSGNYPEEVKVKTSGSAGAPVTFSATGTVTVGSGKTHGFTISSRSWVVVNGFTVSDTTGDGIYVTGSHHITVSANHVSYSGQPADGLTARGIRLSGSNDSTISGNTADHNSEAGIYVTSNSTRNQIVGNVTAYNARGYIRAAAGIDVRSPGNTVANNVSHHNEDTGIQFYTGAADGLVRNNVCYDNGDHGIDNLNVGGQRIIGNTVYRNVTAGINLEGSSSGGTVVNNISVDNGIGSPRTKSNIRVDANSIPGARVDSNLVHLTQPSPMYTWGTTSYTSLSAFQAATGQEPHGLQAAPSWRSAGAGDFHLNAGSPAIDSADSGVSGQSPTDADGNGRVDDPATPNTGLGPRRYDDRGAYEFQP